jgi:GNAT superfamily N-acetyltransferase
MKLVIHRITLNDFPTVVMLHNQCWGQPNCERTHNNFISDNGCFGLFAKFRDGYFGLFAKYHEIVAGAVYFSTHSLCGRNWLNLNSVDVLQDFRRQGVGRALVEMIVNDPCCRMLHDRAECLVQQSNYASCCFLEACGFEVVDRIFDRFLFRRELNPEPRTITTRQSVLREGGGRCD